MRLTKAQAKLIQWERVARVATVGAAGMPHLVPVCQIFFSGKIYFASGKKGRKILNLRANPKLALTVDLYSDDWDGLREEIELESAARRYQRFYIRLLDSPSERSSTTTCAWRRFWCRIWRGGR